VHGHGDGASSFANETHVTSALSRLSIAELGERRHALFTRDERKSRHVVTYWKRVRVRAAGLAADRDANDLVLGGELPTFLGAVLETELDRFADVG